MAGYSETPLIKKLGFTAPMVVFTVAAPADYATWLGAPPGVTLSSRARSPIAAAHLFVTERADLARHLTKLRKMLEPAGFVWVSWPKKAAKVSTDITDNTIRDVALPMGWVDIKVCAVNELWSGLKLVIRKELR